MRYDMVIKGGRVATAEAVFTADIAIAGGRIAALGTDLTGAETLDATGLIVTPGGVDPHCHIEQMSGMGQMNADTFETATRSAAMGGTTTVISFAAQAKGQRLADAAADYAARGERGRGHRLRLSPDPRRPGGARLRGRPRRADRAGQPLPQGLHHLQYRPRRRGDPARAHHRARRRRAHLHPRRERRDHRRGPRPPPGRGSHAAHRPRRLPPPREAEIEAVARMCRLAEAARAPVMIFHVSTAEAVAEIAAARARGAPVWAETCPHYLFQTEEVLDRPGIEGAKWMCSPPQRTVADQEALWAALARGDLQVVSSDHAPYRFDETGKLSAGPDAPFPAIANGMPGLEVRLPLMFDAMVSRGRLGLSKFVDLTATTPARLYGLTTKGHIAPGYDADLTLWDPDKTVTYGATTCTTTWATTRGRGTVNRLAEARPPPRTAHRLGRHLSRHPRRGQWLHRAAIGTDPAHITGTAT
jgi:dihydropyrimidinase